MKTVWSKTIYRKEEKNMLSQILAVVIFVAMFILIITEIFERHITTLTCALLTILLVFGLGMHSLDAILSTLNVHSIFTVEFWYAAGEASEGGSGIDWATIIFIAGMMVMVEGMAHVGFFRWLCMRIAKIVKKDSWIIFIFTLVDTISCLALDALRISPVNCLWVRKTNISIKPRTM